MAVHSGSGCPSGCLVTALVPTDCLQSFTITGHLVRERAHVENNGDRVTLGIPECPRDARTRDLALGRSVGGPAVHPLLKFTLTLAWLWDYPYYFVISPFSHPLFAKLLC